ncbi:MAG: hypothetical protein VBE63_01630 [Lamprobacter sp.]|uniref:hypothetical protein n=1 Tax=Lamprobacter sp. TaxID=3100796 RepID=UPI002B258A5E|nr:hypothetical protein [Lamprobacter sp.]MEA3638627.1 hypothetical protein [Lamprobacter sp.]
MSPSEKETVARDGRARRMTGVLSRHLGAFRDERVWGQAAQSPGRLEQSPETMVLTQSLTPSQLPTRIFKRQGSFRGAPRYAEIGRPAPEQLPCEVYIKDGDTYVSVKVVSEPEWADESHLPPINDGVQAKRERLASMQSAAFHYLDVAAIREVYGQEVLAARISPMAEAHPLDEPWLSTDEAMRAPKAETATSADEAASQSELSPEAMFLAYQRRLVAKNEAILDLEFEHRKPEALVQFDRVMRWLGTKYPSTLASETVIRQTRQQIAREETGQQMERLRSGGRAIIHAAFAIEHPKQDVVRLSLLCPATQAFPEAVQIEVNLRTDRIAESWRDQYAMESTITAYVMGTPLNWEKRKIGENETAAEAWVVSMKPFAIYS